MNLNSSSKRDERDDVTGVYRGGHEVNVRHLEDTRGAVGRASPALYPHTALAPAGQDEAGG
jgi:hypothetical protein